MRVVPVWKMREERRVIDGYESDYARDGSRLNFITEIVS